MRRITVNLAPADLRKGGLATTCPWPWPSSPPARSWPSLFGRPDQKGAWTRKRERDEEVAATVLGAHAVVHPVPADEAPHGVPVATAPPRGCSRSLVALSQRMRARAGQLREGLKSSRAAGARHGGACCHTEAVGSTADARAFSITPASRVVRKGGERGAVTWSLRVGSARATRLSFVEHGVEKA
jgi:hypothetical protein